MGVLAVVGLLTVLSVLAHVVLQGLVRRKRL